MERLPIASAQCWDEEALPLSSALLREDAAAVANGILYASGGSINGGFLNTVEAYNPATKAWTTKASMPTARYGLAAGVVTRILYAVGGNNGNVVHAAEAFTPRLLQ